MWLRNRRRKKDSTNVLPERRCFFCNQPSLVLPRSLAHDICNAAGDNGSTDSQGSAQASSSATTHVSLGDINDWTCARCGCRNVHSEQEPNQIASWHDAMAGKGGASSTSAPTSTSTHFAQIPTSRSLTRIASEADCAHTETTATESESPTRSLFCRRCATNQQIQLSLLADFDGLSQQQQEVSPTLAVYRAELDARYPVLCDECRPAVEAEIERRNALARRDIWRARMERCPPSRRSVSGVVGSPHRQEVSGSVVEPRPSGHKRPSASLLLAVIRATVLIWSAVVAIARASRTLFASRATEHTGCAEPLCNTLTSSTWLPLAIVNAVLALVGSPSTVPQDPDEILDTDAESDTQDTTAQSDLYPRRFLSCVHVLSALVLVVTEGVLYDSTNFDVLISDYRRRSTSATSLFDKYYTLIGYCALRAEKAVWRPVITQDTRHSRFVAACLLVTVFVQSICVLVAVGEMVAARWVLRLRHPTRSGPLTRPTTNANDDAPKALSPPVTALDSFSRTAMDSLFKSSSSIAASTTQEDIPTPMDWQPTSTTTHASTTALAPQRFYPPEAQTGLESLLDRGLSLREDHGDEGRQQRLRQHSQSRRESNLWFALGVLSGMVLALGGLVLVLFLAEGYVGSRRGGGWWEGVARQ